MFSSTQVWKPFPLFTSSFCSDSYWKLLLFSLSTTLTHYLPISDPQHHPIGQLLEIAYAKQGKGYGIQWQRLSSIYNEPLASVTNTEGERIQPIHTPFEFLFKLETFQGCQWALVLRLLIMICSPLWSGPKASFWFYRIGFFEPNSTT